MIWKMALLALAGIASGASADVTVTRVPTGGTSATVTELLDGRFRVELLTTRNDVPTTFTIRGGTFDAVEDVIIDNDSNQFTFIEIEGPTSNQSLDSVEDIFVISSTGTVLLSKANVLNDVASIQVNTITGTDIGGDITGDIELIERSGGGFSNIVDMDVGGDIFGDILVNFGDIDDLVVGGSIGTINNKSTISTGRHIFRLVADEIHANITTAQGFHIQRIEAAGVSGTGDFTGSISSTSLTNINGGPEFGLVVDGDLDADVSFSGIVSRPIDIDGKLVDGRIISIGTDLTGPAGDIIKTAANGLEGLIIVNASNGSGTWTGDVTVGTTTLSPEPRYTQLASSLGGGAVGEAPFDFHKTDSEPDYDSTVDDAIPTQVRIKHYGPVHHTGGLGGTGVVTVEKRPISGGNWVDVSSDFIVDASVSQVGFNPSIIVKPTFGNAFEDDTEYRIAPVTGKLLCCHVDGSPDVSWEDTYFKFKIDVP